nr:protein FAR1-RELATED SEQUENCE 5-like [Oryza sativa Japonica Group]
MYNTYAGKIGFSIRKSQAKHRVDGTIYQKYIVCSNQGQRQTKSSLDTTRTSCDARVQFSICQKGIWTVQKVVLEHNHCLVSPNKSHKLRSQRRVIEADRQLIGQIREAGMKPAQVYEFMKEWYGGADKVPFSKMDCNNEIGRECKKYLESNDTQTLLEYLKNKQLKDPAFFYAIQIDKEDGRIANFFWADGQSIMDYSCFGDAVSFDTTFDTNKFEMPFAPLLGTNHHKQTVIFGVALLFNQTIESFVWLFETFLTAMSGKHPSTIFTDQDTAMAAAIALVFPNTRHRLCLWHIYLNGGKNLGHVIHKHPNKFLTDFKRCVYEERSEYHFNKMWHELWSEYKLEDNVWMSNLYRLKKKWAIVFRDSFTADMTSTQRSEGMNNVFKKRFRRKLGLSELLVECDKVAASLRENELDADFKSRNSSPVTCIPNLPMLKTAADSYTRKMYSEFEEEFTKQFSLSCKLLQTEGSILTFMVMPMESDQEATVVYNTADMTITCSCRKYESIGILCKHALRVFNMNEVFTMPSQYILNRWTKYAKKRI